MSKRKVIVIVLVIAIVLVVGKNAFSGEAKKTTATATNKVSVKTQKVEEVTSGAKTTFKASLEAVQEGAVTNKVGGKVTEVFFENGQTMTQGQALVKLDDTDVKNSVASSEAQLSASEAQLKATEKQVTSSELTMQKVQTSYESAERDYNRKLALYNQGAIAKTEFESAETALKNAQTDLATAQNSIESAKLNIETQKANINSAKVNLNIQQNLLQNTTITAPISGVMDGKNVSIGQYVNIGTVLGKVKDISSINAVIQVKESDLTYVKAGGKAILRLDGEGSKEYEGIIQNIDAAADSSARVFSCKIKIDNKNDELKPGVFGNVEIETGSNKKSMELPLKALGGTEGNYYVFINDKGAAKKCIVTTGKISKDSVEIKSGIQVGDEVIITNVSTLLDGDAVTSSK